MLVGTSIGRHQLTKISPKKTIEGSVGSLVLVTLVAIAATWVP
jgi:CDP-diglyceride synthetase